ncbi:MAG: hypothetical protein JXR86_08330 [Spirochaetales bacterium]|nr:hypothetical protein [Spirochaetales bacterium]
MRRYALLVLCLSLFTEALAGESRLIDSINQFRASRGLSVLVPESSLEKTAEQYCGELQETGLLSHTDRRGKRVLDRYREKGGTGVKAGEILGSSADRETLFRAWIDSPAHFQIMTDPGWTRIGAAVKERGEQLVAVVLFSNSLIDSLSSEPAGSSIELILTVLPGRGASLRGSAPPEDDKITIELDRGELPLLLILEGFSDGKRYPSDFIYQSDNF